MHKKWVLLFALLLLIPVSLGARTIIHEVGITLPGSTGIVREKYVLQFNSSEQGAEEKELLENITSQENLTVQDLHPFNISKTVILDSQEESITTTITQSNLAFIDLKYTVPHITTTLEKTEGKEIIGITEQIFSLYNPDTGTITLPRQPLTSISIKLPNSLKVIEERTTPPYHQKERGPEYSTYKWDAGHHSFTQEELRLVYEKEISTPKPFHFIVHRIEITLTEDDSGIVKEEYQIKFSSSELGEKEKQRLKSLAEEEGLTLGELQSFGISKTITLDSQEESITPAITQSDFVFIDLKYTVPHITTTLEEKGGKEIIGITEQIFSLYNPDTGTITLPAENPVTTLIIKVPPSLEVLEERIMPASVQKEEEKGYVSYEWDPPVTDANKLRVVYEKEVTLQKTLTLQNIVNNLTQVYLSNPAYIILTLIIFSLLIIYRKQVATIIEEAFTG